MEKTEAEWVQIGRENKTVCCGLTCHLFSHFSLLPKTNVLAVKKDFKFNFIWAIAIKISPQKSSIGIKNEYA